MSARKALQKAISKLINGTILVVLGTIILLYKINAGVEAPYLIGKYWPLVIIAFGVKYILISLVTVNSREGQIEDEEAEFYMLHYHNPITGMVWGIGFITIGILVLLEARTGFNIGRLANTYWPVILIIAGLNGIITFFFIIYRYSRLIIEKRSKLVR